MRHCVMILSETKNERPGQAKLLREYESSWEDLSETDAAELSATIANFLTAHRLGPGTALPDGVTVNDVAAAVAFEQNV